MKTNSDQSGFLFLPLLLIIGGLILAGGVGMVVTKKLQTPITAPVIQKQPATVEMAAPVVEETSNASTSLPISSSSTPTSVNTLTIDATPKEKEQVVTPVVIPTHTPTIPIPATVVVTPKIEEVSTPNIPETTPPALTLPDTRKLTYDEVKTESKSLTEGIIMILAQNKSLQDIYNRNTQHCETVYTNAVSQAKSDAEYLKNSYTEQRSFGTMPAQYTQVDTALKSDLIQLEAELEYCKTKYTFNASLEADVKKITSAQNGIMIKLTLDNAVDSLVKIRQLQTGLLNLI